MAIFCLSAFSSMVLFFSLVLTSVEFYPHTVRSLGCGVVFCMYLLGRLAFGLHIALVEDQLGREEGML